MTRPVPETRRVSVFEWECAEAPMTGYLQSAAEDVADHGDLITDTHPHELAAAYMIGCATIHAAHVAAEAQQATARAMERIADAMASQAAAQQRQATNLFEAANAINGLADNVRGYLAPAVSSVGDALAVHSDEVVSALESVAASVDALSPTRSDASAPGAADEA